MIQRLQTLLRQTSTADKTDIHFTDGRVRIRVLDLYRVEVFVWDNVDGNTKNDRGFRCEFRRQGGIWKLSKISNCERSRFPKRFEALLPPILHRHLTDSQLIFAGARAANRTVLALNARGRTVAKELRRICDQLNDEDADALLAPRRFQSV